MKKSFKSITSFVIALAMMGTGFVMPASAESIDASTLVVNTIDTPAQTGQRHSVRNVFVGDYNVSGSGIDGWDFNETDATNTYRVDGVAAGKIFRIHDNGYVETDGSSIVGRQITKRPTAPGQYTVTRTSSSGSTYTADGYVARYVGENWGFAGFQIGSEHRNIVDVSEAEGGYAIYTIEISKGSCLEDAYLALSYADTEGEGKITGSDGTARGVAVVGVPLEDYYDVNALGMQTVAVPLSAFEFSKNDDVFTGVAADDQRSRSCTYFTNKESWKANEKVDLKGYISLGVARNDTNPDKVEPFEVTMVDLVIAKAPETTPVLTAEVGSGGVSLSWTASGYTDTTYEITRTSGNKTVVIDAADATSYVDSDVAKGEYTYTVTAKVGEYGIPATSEAVRVGVAVVLDKKAETLLIDDFAVPVGGSNKSAKAKPRPFFMGDYYVSSTNGGTLNTSPDKFQVSNYYTTESDYQTWYIDDFDPNNAAEVGRQITYRPKKAGEYYATRVGNASLKADAYIPHYVGFVNGTQLSDEHIRDNWGFNGYRYSNNVLSGNYFSLEDYVDTAAIAYTVRVPEGANLDGVYLAATYIDTQWWIASDGTHYGEFAVGVPLKNYYDTTVGGWQTIIVPLADYNFAANGGKNDVFYHTCYDNGGYALYEDYISGRKYGKVQWKGFSGIGIVREDVDASKVEKFSIDVKELGVVENIVKAPELTATFDADAKMVNLSWTASGYTDTTYTITKSNGTTTETIDVANATVFEDAAIATGEYTYTVTTKVGKYELGGVSAAAKVAVEIIEEEPPVEPEEPEEDSDYTVVEQIDWANWISGGASLLECRTLYVSPADEKAAIAQGPTNNYNDYHWWSFGTGRWELEINDTGYTNDNASDIAKYAYLADEDNTSSRSFKEIPTSDGVKWGYKGSHYGLGNGGNRFENWPSDRLLGVKDLSAYEDNGYFVFDVKVDDASYDMENAYLAIEVMTDANSKTFGAKDLNGSDLTVELPITAEKYGAYWNTKWEPKTSFVVGVPLLDYYDASKMGQQKVYVPISEFTNNPEFKEMYSKSGGTKVSAFAEKLANDPIDLRLFLGMGVAKKNSDGFETNPKAFKIKVYGLSVETKEVKEPQVTITEVDMGSFAGKAWDVAISYFDAAKDYIASFVDGEESKTGEIGFDGVEADGGSVAFAIFLHTSRANVALNIDVQ